ncbi:LytTR family DNA-binding domain-containing protein [Paraglaciecola sp.]|uniref:LytR/AlgR family response regulator transcription factor n=1 Tax=Paraglaciecola sp. TaxID=1920173 RepID=UPI0032659626
MRLYHIFVCLFSTLICPNVSATDSVYSLGTHTFTQCVDVPTSINFPDFSQPNCQPVNFWEIDPQGKNLWLRTDIPDQTILDLDNRPIGLYLLGKTSSAVYLNGIEIGNNGQPDINQSEEIVGKMDHVFYLPKKHLKQEKNELVLHLSAHHGYLDLTRPIHFLGLATYGTNKIFIQKGSSFGLIFMGMFILSSIYFGSLALMSKEKSALTLLFMMSIFVSAQLAAEISRGVFDYSYPMQDIRLICIALFAMGFGLSLLAFFSHQFAGKHKHHWIYSGALITIIAMVLTPGFDIKTAFAIMLPVIISSLLLITTLAKNFNWYTAKYLVVMFVFISTIVATKQYFHELAFYLIVASLLTYLFFQQAKDYSNKLEIAQAEKTLRGKLELKLEQMQQQKNANFINIPSAGKLDKVPTQEIFYCKASGDYVELKLQTKEVLYSGSLKAIAEQLPTTFIKVHRSYIVNLDKVISLKRDGENGHLILSNKLQIPVSRRMLPQVKESLISHN